MQRYCRESEGSTPLSFIVFSLSVLVTIIIIIIIIIVIIIIIIILTDPDPGGGTRKPEAMAHEKEALRLHSSLPKAHTSVLTQIRTGKMGLAAFVHKCRGTKASPHPGLARCRWQWETAKHMIFRLPALL